MRTSLDGLWGTGQGLARRAAPPTRVVAGLAVFAACLVSSGKTAAGSMSAALAAGAWLALCRPPGGVVRRAGLLGVVLFSPYFLMVPLLGEPVSLPWTVALRGLGGMLVWVATVSVLSAAELRQALVRLPVPGVIAAVLTQIVHQSAVLVEETRQMGAALAVRGATSSRWLLAWQVLFSLPRVWLPRVIARAERVGAAMELRGYRGELTLLEHQPYGLADVAVLAFAVVVLAAAVSVRVLEL